ncbi:LCP family protein [Mycobacterium mantenii]|uniref:LytTR family transcriptional regulator n=1 Tax=Mycobacterium mantenii TaxID=560555 RepID=A0A1A2TLG6_MYCNT|nr:LCP family protein [Mycobacterium mantenii]OBH41340.1 LytTR family transcriptional regulator [Mycobacterium mantenii]OBH51074.1 LytTR family transcriptional regulator [Mycobacterium mantenii]OBH65201.1 LytTR family transcriptional regulator [Mycobacterium mantenii]OBH77288.1 LytTR family transcriptional regulator [Mycobacterium mantenii]
MNGDRSPQRRRPPGWSPPGPPRPEPPQVIRRRAAPPPSPTAETQPLPSAAPPVPSASPPVPPPRPQAPSISRKRRKRRWLRTAVSVLLVGSLLIGAGVIAGAFWFDNKLHREQVLADYADRPATGRGTNWLIVGSDSRQGLSAQQQQDLATGGDIGNGRTDTILLVHIPGVGSGVRTTMVSIPRDSFVPIPGHGKDKINAAFAMGGAQLLVRTVEQATGLRLDHYAEIGFGGFAAVVDALGGVTVCPKTAFDDPLAGIDLAAGCHTVNGRTALGYVRSRDTPRADLDRMVNQRQFVSALLHRATSPAVWLNPWRWYSVPRAAAGALTVDRGDHVWDLARLGWALNGSTTTMTVPIGEFTSGDAGSVVVWNHDEAARLFEALATDASLPAVTTDDQQ